MANEKTTSTNVPTGLILWKCTYNFVAPNGTLRNGALIVEAKDITTAQKVANEKLETLGCAHSRLGTVKQY